MSHAPSFKAEYMDRLDVNPELLVAIIRHILFGLIRKEKGRTDRAALAYHDVIARPGRGPPRPHHRRSMRLPLGPAPARRRTASLIHVLWLSY